MGLLNKYYHQIGKKGILKGWVHGIRGSNQFQFITMRVDGYLIQVVCERSRVGDEIFFQVKGLNQETSIQVEGEFQKSDKAPGGIELILDSLQIIGNSENYPITPKEHGIDFLLENRHLWLRSRKQLPILRIRSELSYQIRKFFHEKEYVNIDTPILTGSIGESAGTLFSTEYFDLGKAYLAQTGQLYLETAIFAHGKVYCFGPTFRAEKSKTRRHLTEFWMVEAETAFFTNHENIQFQEEFVKKIIHNTIQACEKDLEFLERDIEKILKYIEKPFLILDYKEAISLLQKKGQNVSWGDDINAEGEATITEDLESFVFVTNYPKHIKAFYMKENPQDPSTVLCADLLAPDGVGEIIGGSEREDNYEKLIQRLKEENLPQDAYEWYLDLRKYGSVPHAGFGLGLERVVAWIAGLPHVRECIPFPRMLYRLYP